MLVGIGLAHDIMILLHRGVIAPQLWLSWALDRPGDNSDCIRMLFQIEILRISLAGGLGLCRRAVEFVCVDQDAGMSSFIP